MKYLRVALIGALAGALAATPGLAVPDGGNTPAPDVMAKVSAEVRASAEKSDKITFWVRFTPQAELTAAEVPTAGLTKAERGAEVREALIDAADSSQAWSRGLLDATGADYQTFWISNAIKVTGSSKLVDELVLRPEVSEIVADRVYDLPKPIVEPSAEDIDLDVIEWGVDRIGAPGVWTDFGTRGEGIVVANIDSGVAFDHAALVEQYRGNTAGVFDHNYNWFDPSGICPAPAPCDNNNHGTHTMGTMVGDDGGDNQIGVAPGSRWIAAKGCETSGCSLAALLASGEWVIAPTDLNGDNPRPDLAPDIVNNSWGGSGFDPFYLDIVESWVAAGIFPAFSNGNDGPSCNTSGSPGQYVVSYSSGAFDINNAIASFSSRGPGQDGDIKPNLAAPGANVRSSIPSGYANFSGTSMASPHTAAAVALMWSAAPALHGDIEATRDLLDMTAIDVDATECGGTAADNNVWGEGRLDAYTAVEQSPRGATGALEGVITAEGSALAGATVTASGPIERTGTSGPDGAYAFGSLSVGDYTVTASKFGYLPATASATVTDGGVATLDLDLVPADSATLSGTVSTSSGAPIDAATVALAGTGVETTTDDTGFYTLTAPIGDYELTVSSPLLCSDSLTQEVALTEDMVLDVTLPDRVDEFGYGCAAGGPYPEVADPVGLSGDDVIKTVPLPFPVPFYGTTYSSVTISTNGHADLGAAATSFSNTAIPNTAIPNGALYPFWDDLNVDASAAVFSGVIGTAPHRRFVIEWRNVRHFSDTGSRLSVAAALGEDGQISYHYRDLTGTALSMGSSATIGLENATGTVAFQYAFNTPVVEDGLNIEFRTTRHGVVRGTVTDANDTLPIAGADASFELDGVPVGAAVTDADGEYLVQVPAGDLGASFNAASYQEAGSTVSLGAADVEIVDASLATARVTVTPATLEVVVPADETRTRVLTVANDGGLGTAVSLAEVGDVPWLEASLGADSLAPGESTTLTVDVDTTGLSAGEAFVGDLVLASESGRDPELIVRITLIVPGFQAALDAGSRTSHVDPLGDTWYPDAAFAPGGTCGYLGRSNRISTRRDIAGTDDPVRFADARQGMYEYRCDGLADGIYTVELDFAELHNKKPNERHFDVIIEGIEVLPSLDIALEVGTYTALRKSYPVTVADGVLNIRFIQHKGFGKPIVNALRITHRPDLQ